MSPRRTPAQQEAAMRNWGIRQLRALYAQAHMLSRERREAVQAIIDLELAARGAKTHAEHCASLGNRIQRDIDKRRTLRGETELPF